MNTMKAPVRLDARPGAVLTIVPILADVTAGGTGNDICTASVFHGRRRLHEQKKQGEQPGMAERNNGPYVILAAAGTLLKAYP